MTLSSNYIIHRDISIICFAFLLIVELFHNFLTILVYFSVSSHDDSDSNEATVLSTDGLDPADLRTQFANELGNYSRIFFRT